MCCLPWAGACPAAWLSTPHLRGTAAARPSRPRSHPAGLHERGVGKACKCSAAGESCARPGAPKGAAHWLRATCAAAAANPASITPNQRCNRCTSTVWVSSTQPECYVSRVQAGNPYCRAWPLGSGCRPRKLRTYKAAVLVAPVRKVRERDVRKSRRRGVAEDGRRRLLLCR